MDLRHGGSAGKAIEQIGLYLSGPGVYTLKGLSLDPRMDALREQAALEKLVERWGPL